MPEPVQRAQHGNGVRRQGQPAGCGGGAIDGVAAVKQPDASVRRIIGFALWIIRSPLAAFRADDGAL